MSLVISDHRSAGTFVVLDQEAFYLDPAAGAGRLVMRLPKEPNHIQREFRSDQVLVSCWDIGLICCDVRRSAVAWTSSEFARVANIVYSEASNLYYVEREERFGVTVLNSQGKKRDERKDYSVVAAFDSGRHLMVIDRHGCWGVITSDWSVVVATQLPMRNEVLSVAGHSGLVIFTLASGSINGYDLVRGEVLFRIESERWFNVSSVVVSRDQSRFRALARGWNSEAITAVIEVDIRKQKVSLVTQSKDWNLNATLAKFGEVVVRFTSESSDRFTVTRL